MILVDTAPLIALIDTGEAHRRCVKTYYDLDRSMLTTWCCFTFVYRLYGKEAFEVVPSMIN